MKRPHLLRVEAPPETFAPLFAAATTAGLRLGWLDLADPLPPLPAALAEAARQGALRAVAVGREGTVVVKPRRGAPVLDDLLREHFLGTAAVLVRGAATAPRLSPLGDAQWRVATPEGNLELTTEGLVTRLRRPRPW
jgi:hypothetical protein